MTFINIVDWIGRAFVTVGSLGILALVFEWSSTKVRNAFVDANMFIGYVVFRHRWRANSDATLILRNLRQAKRMFEELDKSVNSDRLHHYRRLADDYLEATEVAKPVDGKDVNNG